ncbi:MAG: transketolase [Acidobacteria bacterium]|nr:MAG: transketolase [Acidobacteriota bacterium]
MEGSRVALDLTAQIALLRNVATRLRIDSIRATTAAGSGHPSTCCSAADIAAALFFAEMRFDPQRPEDPDNDRFVLSKGHAAPLLYAAWAEAGAFPREDLLRLRELGSDLEGHPTPRLPFVDVATGSLGQGVGAAVGIALNARRTGSAYRTYVLIGDGESAEGSVWEAAAVAAHYELGSLCGITDVNALGQSGETAWGHDLQPLRRRWEAFGWNTILVDGHDISDLLGAFEAARRVTDRPTMILARTVKGKGVSFVEGKGGWHGRPLKKDEEALALAELEAQFVPGPGEDEAAASIAAPPRTSAWVEPASGAEIAPPAYAPDASIATREAYGTALVKLGTVDPRVVVLDADVKNSTFSDKFEKVFPQRFFQHFIAEQAMLGVAMGLASRGAIAFPSTFAAFFTRAYDFIRMAAISGLNVKMTGSHAGVSIGEDGPSQMGLEDLAMMRTQPNIAVLYPCDAVSTERLVAGMAYHPGPVYLRTSRPKTPVIYGNEESFPIGGCKVLRRSENDVATVIAAGVTLFEALKAYEQLEQAGIAIRVIDLYSIQPIDGAALRQAAAETNGRLITVEDHYAGGGIGDAVAAATTGVASVQKLAVREIPRSGKPDELLDRFGISASHIVTAVKG